MKSNILAATVALLSGIVTCIGADLPTLPKQVNEAYMSYKQTSDPDLLSKAIASIDRQPVSGASDMITLRAALLKKIASEYDPTYDSNPPPPVQANVMPPVGYDSGVSPMNVSDPIARAEYEKRIAENAANARQHKIQTSIRRLMDSIVMLTMKHGNNDLTLAKNRFNSLELPNSIVDALNKSAIKTKETANHVVQPTR